MTKRQSCNQTKHAAANDNSADIIVMFKAPKDLGIIVGEADLIAHYLGDLLHSIANDNEAEDNA